MCTLGTHLPTETLPGLFVVQRLHTVGCLYTTETLAFGKPIISLISYTEKIYQSYSFHHNASMQCMSFKFLGASSLVVSPAIAWITQSKWYVDFFWQELVCLLSLWVRQQKSLETLKVKLRLSCKVFIKDKSRQFPTSDIYLCMCVLSSLHGKHH